MVYHRSHIFRAVKYQHSTEDELPQLLGARLDLLAGAEGVPVAEQNLSSVRVRSQKAQFFPGKCLTSLVRELAQDSGPGLFVLQGCDLQIVYRGDQRRPVDALPRGQSPGAELPPGQGRALWPAGPRPRWSV